MVNTSQQVGGAIGTALLSTLALSATRTYTAAHTDPFATSQEAATTHTLAMVHGYITAFWWAAALLLAAAVVSFVFISFRVGVAPVPEVQTAPESVVDVDAAEFVLPLHDTVLIPGPHPELIEPVYDRIPSAYNGDGVLIHGRVRDRGGAPMPLAVITAVSPQGRQVGRARSGADGGYQIGVPRVGAYVLIVAADGREPEASTITARERSVSHDILLAERGRLAVAVRSTDGTGIGGATLMLTDPGGDPAHQPAHRRGRHAHLPRPARGPADAGGQRRRAPPGRAVHRGRRPRDHPRRGRAPPRPSA